MKAILNLIFILSLLFIINLTAETWDFNDGFSSSGDLSMIYQSSGGVGMRFNMGKLNINNIVINNHLMKSIVIPEIYGPGEPGKPYLPQISRLVAVPQGASASIQLLSSKTYEISGVVPWCSPESLPYNNINSIIFKPDSSVYYGNKPYPEEIIRVSEPFMIRGLDVVRVTIEPFQWDPRDSVLTVYTSVNLNISFIGGNGYFGEDRLRSRYWDRILSCNVINFRSLKEIDYSKRVIEKQSLVDAGYPYGAEFVIIVPDDEAFISAAEIIKDLRQEEGILTEIFTLTELGNTFNEIQSWIDNAYNTWLIPPEAILFLGDCKDANFTEGIPSKIIYNNLNSFTTWASDNYYADVDEDEDLLPDIAVGRIPARNVQDLENIVSKIQQIELNPTNNGVFYSNVLVSGAFQYHSYYDFHTLSEVIRGFYEYELNKTVTRLYVDYPDSVIHDTLHGYPWMPGGVSFHMPGMVEYFSSLGYITDSITEDFLISSIWNKTASHIKNTIENGCFIVYNHGHGGVGKYTPVPSHWSQPWYSVWDLNNLYNYGDEIPYVYALGCWAGKFDDTLIDGYRHHSEQFMFLSPNAAGLKRGAIGVTSASYCWGDAGSHFLGYLDFMYPNFDPQYPKGPSSMMDTFHEAMPGFALTSGKIYMRTRNINWHYAYYGFLLSAVIQFHHFGDPYLRLYTEIPENMMVSLFPFIQAGENTCYVNAPIHSMITLIADDIIIGRKQAINGYTAVEIIPQDFGTEIKVIVTKQNCYRYYDSISVILENGAYLKYHGIHDISGGIGNNQINPGQDYELTLRFINFGDQSLDSFWVYLSSDDSFINFIDTGTVFIGYVSAFDTVDIVYDFSISFDTQDQHQIDNVLDYGYRGTGTFNEELSFVVNRPNIDFDSIDELNVLIPGDTFYIGVNLINSGTGDDWNIEMELNTQNEYIYLIDSVEYVELSKGGSYFQHDSIFKLYLSTDFADTIIEYSITVKSDYFTKLEKDFVKKYYHWKYLREYFEDGLDFFTFTGDLSWVISKFDNHTPGIINGHVLYCGDEEGYYSNNITDSRAILNCVWLGAAGNNFFMTWWQRYELEQNKDGVQVEFRFQGDSLFSILNPVESYTGISEGFGGFEVGELFYSGDCNIWHEQHFHYKQDVMIPESIFVSWRFGSNDTIVKEGYYLDDIAISRHHNFDDEQIEAESFSFGNIDSNPVFAINKIYPNPARSRTQISFSVGKQEQISLLVYDISGRKVRTLIETELMPGKYIAEWDCRDDENKQVSSGIYYYIFHYGNEFISDKIIIVR